jgi:RNA polymerase sigma factor (sigma-70 family)
VEKYISKDHISRRELPLQNELLYPLLEDYLQQSSAPYYSRQQLPPLEDILSSLTPLQQTLIKLHFIEGHSLAQVAKRLNLTKKVVTNKLSWIKKKLEKNFTNKSKKK